MGYGERRLVQKKDSIKIFWIKKIVLVSFKSKKFLYSIIQIKEKSEGISMMENCKPDLNMIPTVLQRWMEDVIMQRMVPLINEKVEMKVNQILENRKVQVKAEEKSYTQNILDDANQGRFENPEAIKQLSLLQQKYRQLSSDFERSQEQQIQMQNGQADVMNDFQQTLRKLQAQNAYLRKSLEGVLRMDLNQWEKFGMPNETQRNFIRYGLQYNKNQNIFQNRNETVSVNSSSTVRWQHSIVKKNKWTIEILSCGNMGLWTNTGMVIGICDKNSPNDQIRQLIVKSGKYSPSKSRPQRTEPMPGIRAICYRSDGFLIHSGVQKKTVNPSFKAGDKVQVQVDLNEGIIYWNINGMKNAFYQNESIKENMENWIPFVGTIQKSSQFRPLTTYV